MKVNVPPIGIELEGVIQREERYLGHVSSYALKERVEKALGDYVSFEGGASNQGVSHFEVKTNPSCHIQTSVDELSGLIRAVHNEMATYHAEALTTYTTARKEIEADIAGLTEEERREYFLYQTDPPRDDSHQRLMFSGLMPHAGDGSAFNAAKYGATSNYSAGLHLHAGVDFKDQLRVAKKLEPYAPLLTALTAASPFDHDGNLGWASYRMQQRTDQQSSSGPVQPYFFRHGEEFKGGAKYNRPETLECVVMDSTSSLQDIACVSAIYQALVSKALTEEGMACMLKSGMYADPEYSGNMSRVCKDGLDAELICVDGTTKRASEAVEEMLEELAPYTKAISTQEVANHARTIIREGTSADRQAKCWRDAERYFEAQEREEALNTLAFYRTEQKDITFDALPLDMQNSILHGEYGGYEAYKKEHLAEKVERHVVRESLQMARAGRGKAPAEDPITMLARPQGGTEPKSAFQVRKTLEARGETLEVSLDEEERSASLRDGR